MALLFAYGYSRPLVALFLKFPAFSPFPPSVYTTAAFFFIIRPRSTHTALLATLPLYCRFRFTSSVGSRFLMISPRTDVHFSGVPGRLLHQLPYDFLFLSWLCRFDKASGRLRVTHLRFFLLLELSKFNHFLCVSTLPSSFPFLVCASLHVSSFPSRDGETVFRLEELRPMQEYV